MLGRNPTYKRLCLAASIVLILCGAANAVNIYWDNGAPCDPSWATGPNWEGDTVPLAGDQATFGKYGDVPRVGAEVGSGVNAANLYLWLGRNEAAGGYASVANVDINGGALTSDAWIVGGCPSCSGTFSISSGSASSDLFIYLGRKGDGKINMTGGTLSTANLWVATLNAAGTGSDASTGTIYLDGGLIDVGTLHMSEDPEQTPGNTNGGIPRIHITGGTMNVNDADGSVATKIQNWVTVNNWISGYGHYDLAHVIVSWNGVDKTTVTAVNPGGDPVTRTLYWTGAQCNPSWGALGNWDYPAVPTANDVVSLGNWGLLPAPGAEIGSGVNAVASRLLVARYGGPSELTVNGGSLTVSGMVTIGDENDVSGTLRVKSGTMTAGDVEVGLDGNGVLAMQGGTATLGQLSVAVNAGSTGRVSLDSGVINVAGLQMSTGARMSITEGTLNIADSDGSVATQIENWVTVDKLIDGYGYFSLDAVIVNWNGSDTTTVTAVYPAVTPPDLLYVASYESDEILRYSAVDGTFLGTLVFSGKGGLNGPRGLARSVDKQTIYVASENTDEVLAYNGLTGAVVGTFVTAGSGGLDAPRGIAFGPDGNLHVASSGTDQVLRYQGQTGAFLGAFVTAGSGGLDMPHGLVFAEDGNLYVSSWASDQILRYQGQTGAFMDAFVTAGSGGLDSPAGFAFGGDGNLYVSSWATDRVLRYNGQTGASVDTYIIGANNPMSLAFGFGSDTNLYVCAWGDDAVTYYDTVTPTPTPLGVFGDANNAGSGLNRPADLIWWRNWIPGDFDGDGDVDERDLDHFETCATGPGIPLGSPACMDADLEGDDNDVDQADFAVLQRCFSGTSVPANPGCAN